MSIPTSQVDGIFSKGDAKKSHTVLGQSPYDDNYKMNHENRGLALIFNHQTFEHPLLSDRKGSEIDRDALSQILSRLRFKVETYQDLSRNELLKVLDQAAKVNHQNNDCLVVAIMTHGENEGRLYANDTHLYVDTIVNKFSGQNCPSLAGKPKLFFIQACKGTKTDPGNTIRVQSDAVDENLYTIPSMADILIMYATIEGFYAWRDTKKGSWFIQSLVQQLEQNHDKRDLLSILTLVNRQVAIGYESSSYDPELDNKKEMCSIVSMLTRNLYFQ